VCTGETQPDKRNEM